MLKARLLSLVLLAIFVIIVVWMFTGLFKAKPSVLGNNYAHTDANRPVVQTQTSPAADDREVVPWDYRLEQKQVGDLLNGDMALLPENQLLPNDDNYATGDQVWVLEDMEAVLTPRPDGSNDVSLTAWKPVKSYRAKTAADDDLARLKEQVQTEVPLVGVYKTELDGKFREFAVLTLPSGNAVKEPIDETRYADMKDKKQVKVKLEVVHALNDYDQAMPKFRGWSE